RRRHDRARVGRGAALGRRVRGRRRGRRRAHALPGRDARGVRRAARPHGDARAGGAGIRRARRSGIRRRRVDRGRRAAARGARAAPAARLAARRRGAGVAGRGALRRPRRIVGLARSRRRAMSRRTRRARAAASLAAAASVVTALIPLTAVFSPNWFAAALVAAVAVPAVGAAGRLVHNGLAILAQVAVGFAIAWWRFPGGLAGGLLPWDGAWALPGVLATARDEVLTGVVPVAVGAPLDFLLVGATALLAVVVDQLAVAARLPLVATLLLVAVFVAPQLAVPRGDDLLLALPSALALLALFAGGSAPRRRRARGGRGSAMPAATIGVAIVSALATLAIAPAVPILPAGQQGLVTRPLSIAVSLDLGDDLRNTSSAEVLRVCTDAAQAPYPRLATHTGYGDDGWQVDAGASSPIAEGFPELSTNGVVGEVESRSTSTWVSDVQLEAAY